MHMILKSQIVQAGIDDVQKTIDDFAKEYKIWVSHMIKVNHPDNQILKDGDEKKYAPYPPPSAHPLIVGAVDLVGNVSFQVIDDTEMQAEQTVEQRRQALMDIVTKIEHDEIAKIAPPGKIRLWNMRESAIIKADQEKQLNIQKDFYVRNEEVDIVKLEAHIKDTRTPEDTAHLELMKEKKIKIDAIYLWGATLHAEIEDLAAENIFEWEVPSYQ